MNKFYVTTPIYYVNDVPHIGHAYTTIAADILARHHRQLGQEVFFLTGTDEHGNPAARAALRRGITPEQHVNDMVIKFKELAAAVGATNDFFIRTTDKEHVQAVQEFIQRLYDRGEIYRKSYRGLYCGSCESFYSEKDLREGKCPDHDIELELVEEENYFFRLSDYKERLLEHFDAHPDFVIPKSRLNEARSFITRGLEDISISRAALEWGIPIPWDQEQVVYVWVDALLNYISALRYAREEDVTVDFWPADYHLMAKDILKFHAVIWPALLMAAGYELPRHLFVHGYLLMGGQKMSKTRGNVLDPFAVMDKYSVDAFRFYCFREVTFGQDGVVSMEGFESRYNKELANDLGNLVSRIVAMVKKYTGSSVPAPSALNTSLSEAVAGLRDEVISTLAAADITGCLEQIWQFVRRLNKHVEDSTPWALAKEPHRRQELDNVLYELVEGLRVTAIFLHAFIPATTVEILRRLGYPPEFDEFLLEKAKWGRAAPERLVEGGEPLFPKLD